MTLIAAIYFRVSTADQSVESQLRDLREFFANRGLKGLPEYCDAGISVLKDSRPVWNQFWDTIQKVKHNIHALDRIGRSLPLLVGILEYLRAHNIALISYRENIDLSSSTGKMLAGIFSLMAEYERNNYFRADKVRLAGRTSVWASPAGYSTGTRSRDLLANNHFGQIRTARALGVRSGTIHKFRQSLVRDGILPPTIYLTKGAKIATDLTLT